MELLRVQKDGRGSRPHRKAASGFEGTPQKAVELSVTPADCESIFSLHICGVAPKLFSVTRRGFIQSGLAVGLGTPLFAALRRERMDEAVEILARATREGQVAAAGLHVVQREKSFT